jgi:polycomb protein EED
LVARLEGKLKANGQSQAPPVLNSLAWTKNMATGQPLLCVAGQDARIKLLDLNCGLQRILVGHGDAINDIAISPASPSILASCSTDRSVRVWNLGESFRKEPCAVILRGIRHTEAVLTIVSPLLSRVDDVNSFVQSFHDTGRFLLSAGNDCVVNMWVLPKDIEELPRRKENKNNAQPAIIPFPHFSTRMLHRNYVDKVQWFGDLILSKGLEEAVLLWRIDNFSSRNEPPEEAPAASLVERETTSAFSGEFELILTLQNTNACDYFYERFGLCNRWGNQHAILAAGNDRGEVRLWDFGELERSRDREDPRYQKYNEFQPILAHQVVSLLKNTIGEAAAPVFCVDWSRSGQWCIAAGQFAMVGIMSRDLSR